MRIWLVGGGTAGHALPLIALASELEQSGARPLIVTDHNPAAAAALSGSRWPIKRLRSGKFRRYHGRGWSSRLLDIGTLMSNLVDLFKVGVGLIQAVGLMLRRRPDVVFINGGSVGVPVAWAARLLGRPYLIHESDTMAGLANRLIEPSARRVLIGLANADQVQDERHVVTGIPLRPGFAEAKAGGAIAARRKLGFNTAKPMVLITGGSQGAANLNQAVVSIAPRLVESANVVHLAGAANVARLKSRTEGLGRGYRLVGFAAEEMADYLAAADLVVARAGASTLADLAYFAKPAIIVPNPMLSGGHQLSNARSFTEAKAALVLDEDELKNSPERLLDAIRGLLGDKKHLARLSRAIAGLARPDATQDIAKQILGVGRGE